MEDVFQFGDELGPAKVMHIFEPSLGLKAVLVIDNVARGPAVGGLRMASDVSARECFRLARAMTMKNAAAGLAHGGGKSVLYGDPRMPRENKEALVRAFAHALRNETDYIVGPDMGTDETCMACGSRMRSAVPWVCRRRSAESRSTRSAPPASALPTPRKWPRRNAG